MSKSDSSIQTPPLADRITNITPFHVMELLQKAQQMQAQGEDVIHLEVGEPDFPTPSPIIAAGMQALQNQRTKYTPALGLPALRNAIADYYWQTFDQRISSNQVCITTGASGGLLCALSLLINSGRQVLLSDPGYPCNINLMHTLQIIPKLMQTTAQHGFQITPELISNHWGDNVAGLIAATPSNPSGALLSLEALSKIVHFVRSKQGHCIIDEIYQGLTYTGEAYTAVGLHPDLFVVNSFSKYFGMTGWRVGWMVVPEWATPGIEKLLQNLFIAAPTISQHAAIAAFEPETITIIDQQSNELKARRDFLIPALRNIGFEIAHEPEGAFYIYCDVRTLCRDSFQFCHELLEATGVAITPGRDFGQHEADHYIRIAYTAPISRLEEAVQRIAKFLL